MTGPATRTRPARRARRAVALLALAAAGAWPAACERPSAEGRPALIFAAASLAAPFASLIDAFARAHPDARLELHVAGTPQLVMQLREGAPADVFASADEEHMAAVVEAGLAALAPVVFAGNHLAVVTAPGNPHGIHALSDLARPDLRVLLCGPQVPAGRYARRALERAGVRVSSVSDEPSVQALMTKLRLGEVDAAVVYATDAALAGDAVHAVPIPDGQNVAAAYPAVVLASGGNPDVGRAFVAFLTSREGRGVLNRFGFTTP